MHKNKNKNKKTNNAVLPRFVLLAAGLCMLGGCGSGQSMEEHGRQTTVLPQVQEVRRESEQALDEMGDMIAALLPQTVEIVVELSAGQNLTGVDKLPPTFAPHVVWALDRVGLPIRNQQTYAATIFLNGSNGLREPQGSVPTDRRPLPALVLDCNMIAYSEAVVRELELRGDVLVAIGSGQADAGLSTGTKKNLVNIATSFQPRNQNGVSYAGTNATLELWLLDDTASGGFSAYFGGSGAGLVSRLVTVKDRKSALMDLAAFSVIKSLGSALGLPYHRLSPVFRRDARYVEGVRRAYLTQSRDKQLLDLKQLLWTSGNKQIQIDEAAVTPTDVDIINGAVRGLKADPTTGDGFATLYMNMWENLDFRGGAKRVAERRVVVSEFQQRAAQIQELAMAREAQYLAASSYGLPAGTPVMVLDTRTLDATRRGLFMDRLTLISGYRGAVRGPVPGIDALVLEGQSARELLQFVRKDEILTSGFAVHLADSQRRLVVH